MAIQIDAPDRVPRPRATALTSLPAAGDRPVRAVPEPLDRRRHVRPLRMRRLGHRRSRTTAATRPRSKPTPQGFDAAVTFPAFIWHAAIQCSTLWMTAAELHKHLDVLLESELSAIFAEQVMQGLYNPAAPTLYNQADDVSQTGMGGGAMAAVAAVEDGLADRWRDSIGMIHVPPSVFIQIADTLEYADGRFYTPSGHIVVADAGYQAGSPGSGVITSGVAWVYGSSCVHYRYLRPDWQGYDFENINFAHNDQTVRVEGIGVAVFEPCSVVCEGRLPLVPGMMIASRNGVLNRGLRSTDPFSWLVPQALHALVHVR